MKGVGRHSCLPRAPLSFRSVLLGHRKFLNILPQAITISQFSHALAKTLHRPCLFKFPSFLLKIILGEMSILMLASCKAFPEKLMTAGFQFEYADLNKALKALLQK
jgi:NAD dependent epimerase/dehydratase family enzyme